MYIESWQTLQRSVFHEPLSYWLKIRLDPHTTLGQVDSLCPARWTSDSHRRRNLYQASNRRICQPMYRRRLYQRRYLQLARYPRFGMSTRFGRGNRLPTVSVCESSLTRLRVTRTHHADASSTYVYRDTPKNARLVHSRRCGNHGVRHDQSTSLPQGARRGFPVLDDLDI